MTPEGEKKLLKDVVDIKLIIFCGIVILFIAIVYGCTPKNKELEKKKAMYQCKIELSQAMRVCPLDEEKLRDLLTECMEVKGYKVEKEK